MGDDPEITRNSRCRNSFERRIHLDILIPPPNFWRKLAFTMPFLFRQPLSQANETPDHPKHDADTCQNTECVASQPTSTSAGIEKIIGVESLGGMGDISQSEIEGQNDDEK